MGVFVVGAAPEVDEPGAAFPVDAFLPELGDLQHYGSNMNLSKRKK